MQKTVFSVLLILSLKKVIVTTGFSRIEYLLYNSQGPIIANTLDLFISIDPFDDH